MRGSLIDCDERVRPVACRARRSSSVIVRIEHVDCFSIHVADDLNQRSKCAPDGCHLDTFKPNRIARMEGFGHLAGNDELLTRTLQASDRCRTLYVQSDLIAAGVPVPFTMVHELDFNHSINLDYNLFESLQRSAGGLDTRSFMFMIVKRKKRRAALIPCVGEFGDVSRVEIKSLRREWWRVTLRVDYFQNQYVVADPRGFVDVVTAMSGQGFYPVSADGLI